MWLNLWDFRYLKFAFSMSMSFLIEAGHTFWAHVDSIHPASWHFVDFLLGKTESGVQGRAVWILMKEMCLFSLPHTPPHTCLWDQVDVVILVFHAQQEASLLQITQVTYVLDFYRISCFQLPFSSWSLIKSKIGHLILLLSSYTTLASCRRRGYVHVLIQR